MTEMIETDFPSIPTEGRKAHEILAAIDGRALVIEGGLEHRTGHNFLVISAYDNIGVRVFDATTDCHEEMEMAKKVTTLKRNEHGLPLEIEETELRESLFHGLVRMALQDAYADHTPLISSLRQARTFLSWSTEGYLNQVTTYSLSGYQGETEVFVPESEEKYEYDPEGKIIRISRVKYEQGTPYIDTVELYQHNQFPDGNNQVTELIYERDKNTTELTLNRAYTTLYDQTRERVAHGLYANTILGIQNHSKQPVYDLKPEYGGNLMLIESRGKSAYILQTIAPTINAAVTIAPPLINLD